MLMAFYKKLIAKVCGEKTCSPAFLQACWDVATGALKVMINEVHKERVHTSSAHTMKSPEGLGRFLHTTLQELRVLKDSKVKMIENHYLVRIAMVTHLFNTYISKSDMNFSKLNTSSLEIKCNELESTVRAQKKLTDINATAVGNLRKEVAKEK